MCPWPAPVGAAWWVERSGGPEGAWNAEKSPPFALSAVPTIISLFQNAVQDVHLDFMCQGITTALSQGCLHKQCQEVPSLSSTGQVQQKHDLHTDK